MFLAGLELQLRVVRRHDRTLAAVSLGAVALPFGLGIAVAALVFPAHALVAGRAIRFVPFALFVATALSITAFPVLVRIVGDRGLRATRLGQLAISSAAIQDVAGWTLLAVSLAALRGGDPSALARTALEALAFVACLLGAVRPGLRWWCARHGDRGATEALPVVIGLLAACAAVTQLIGLHSVIGAFALGAVFPRREGSALIPRLRRALGPATITVLLPVYLLLPGLHVNARAIDSGSLWQLFALAACACAGKLAGSAVPARVTGLSWREASALGALLNARGLIELVVLTVGLNAGLLDQRLFSMMVLVAILTTLLAGPLLTRALARGEHSPELPALGAVGVSVESG
jgi:Kef-type K+ transport system membrane component KefB